MSYCMSPQDFDYPCSNRNKCKNSRKYRNDIHERPVRDTPGIITEPTISHFPPPEPPGPPSDWELQYCKWSGWTWVKKSDKEVSRPQAEPNQFSDSPAEVSRAHHHPQDEKKKKKGGLFSCFKKSPPESRASQNRTAVSNGPPPTPKPVQTEPQPTNNDFNDSVSDGFDDCCCCGMDYECCCNVCPCMTQVCCCCPREHEQGKRRESKTIETQTVKEMKEKATKMSEMHIPKPRPCCGRRRKCKCRCRRPVCCPCKQKTCCPCVQPVCCPCKSNQPNGSSSKRKNDDSSTINSDNIVNFCLANYLGSKKPNDFKSNPLVKSVDLLLKNNINIMNLFNDKKELKHQAKPIVSNQTISCLSSDNLIKRTDQEHNKLLTAVCDAILSSHKFDNDKFSSKPQFTESRINFKNSDSKESFNIFSSKEILGRILSDLNFTMSKGLDGSDIPKETGVRNNGAPKIESFCYPRRSLTKLIRNKSRILAAPRFPKKIEALRRLDSLKSGRDELKIKRGFGGHYRKVNGLKMDDSKKGRFDESKLNFTDIFKNSEAVNKFKSDQKSPQMCSTSKQDTSKLESIEALLRTLDLTDDSTSVNFKPHEKTDIERNRLETLLQDHQLQLLDSTSPPFTDFDLLLTNDEGRQEVQDNNKPKENCSR